MISINVHELNHIPIILTFILWISIFSVENTMDNMGISIQMIQMTILSILYPQCIPIIWVTPKSHPGVATLGPPKLPKPANSFGRHRSFRARSAGWGRLVSQRLKPFRMFGAPGGDKSSISPHVQLVDWSAYCRFTHVLYINVIHLWSFMQMNTPYMESNFMFSASVHPPAWELLTCQDPKTDVVLSHVRLHCVVR